MTMTINKDSVATVIGRFQVDELHKGHRHLIDTANNNHQSLLILVGTGISGQPTRKYPLPFDSIKTMINQSYPNATVLKLEDIPASDEEWSNQVDYMILLSNHDTKEVKLYGSRDSFIPYYKGRFECVEVEEIYKISGTKIREEISRSVPTNREQRKGAIWSVNNKFPVSYQCVDVAIFNKDYSMILLGKKKQDGKKWRFPGGFVDPCETLEMAATREAKEETNANINNIKYIESFVIDDQRYMGEKDNITSALFSCIVEDDSIICSGDDLDEIKWFDFNTINLGTMVGSHTKMLKSLFTKIS